MTDITKMSNTQFLNQFILFEDDQFIKDWEKEIREFIENIPVGKMKHFIDDIAEIKTMQKLENAPFALLALVPQSFHRDNTIEEIILSVENGLAMMKWIWKFYQIDLYKFFNKELIESIENAINALSWPKHIPAIYSPEDSFKIKCKIVSSVVDERNKSLILKKNRWGDFLYSRNNKGNNIPEEKLDDIELVEILANIRELNHIGMKKILSVIRGKSLNCGYIQPIQILESILLHKSCFETYRLIDPGTKKLNDCLSEILESQLSGLQKLNDKALFLIDGSGSMESCVSYAGHNIMDRSHIAILWAIVFGKLCKDSKCYITAAQERHIPIVREIQLPCNILEAIDIVRKIGIGCGGIYVHSALELIKEKLKRDSFVPKICMVFADSEDDTPEDKRWPRVAPIRIADKMLLINAEHQGKRYIETNAQWDAHICGYTDYAVEFAYDSLGIANPTAKGSDFANGANYRVSF